jgi:hypothetical protein
MATPTALRVVEKEWVAWRRLWKASGRGVATDVVEASARAYLAAVNKIVRLRERPDRREVTEVGP